MYRLLQNDFEPIFTRIARNSILHIAGDYKAPDYWLARSTIGDAITATLIDDLKQANAHVSGFMLLKIDLPDVYEAAIVETEVTTQEKTKYDNLRNVNVTHQKTENIMAAAKARISVINAKATSNATKILNKGAGLVQKQNIEYTSQAFMEIQK